ncbi:MAG: hypothetical protein JSV86_05985 [Gemmatimonadota bacterium]|nr:MAG: hypothetical protein JSV86_05985 [Gemmatimonadota bacterium]
MPEAVSLMADVVTVPGGRALVRRDLSRAEAIVSELLLPQTPEPRRRILFLSLARLERSILSRFAKNSDELPTLRIPKRLKAGLNLARLQFSGNDKTLETDRKVFVFERA